MVISHWNRQRVESLSKCHADPTGYVSASSQGLGVERNEGHVQNATSRGQGTHVRPREEHAGQDACSLRNSSGHEQTTNIQYPTNLWALRHHGDTTNKMHDARSVNQASPSSLESTMPCQCRQ